MSIRQIDNNHTPITTIFFFFKYFLMDFVDAMIKTLVIVTPGNDISGLESVT